MAKRAARAAFSGDGDQDGHGKARHFAQVVSDGFGLAALFGVHAGICAGRIHEDEDGAVEFRGELHRAQGFAIAFGLGLAEIAREALLGVAAFLAADDHYGLAVKFRHAGDQRGVVGKIAVAVDFGEIVEEQADEIVGVGALGMAGEQEALPGAEMSVEIALELVHFPADAFDFAGLVAAGRRKQAEFGHVALERVNYPLLLFILFAAGAGWQFFGRSLLRRVLFCAGVRIFFFLCAGCGILGRCGRDRPEILARIASPRRLPERRGGRL